MKKLTLEQISPYLPYGLKYKDIPEGYSGIRILKLNTIEWCLTNGKPILHPISDLTKPITVDGVEQIPAIVIGKIVGDIHNDDLDDKWVIRDNGYVSIKTPWDLRIEIFYKTPSLAFSVYDTWNYKEKRTHGQYLAFQYLAKHKFDFMGLIDAGLAVDVNTLEINPYK